MTYVLDGILKPINIVHAMNDAPSASLLFKSADPVLIDAFQYGAPTIWVLLDKNIQGHPETKRIIDELIQSLGGNQNNILITAIEGGEDCKSTPAFLNASNQALEYFGRAPGMMVAIGGGSILNLATFIAATLHHDGLFFFGHKEYAVAKSTQRSKNFVLIPTTILAVADVAYGSKGNINMLNGDNHILTECMLLNGEISETPEIRLRGQSTQKHGWKIYLDPSEIYVSPEYIRTLPVAEIKRGLSEVLKHALLQDASKPKSAFFQLLNAAFSALNKEEEDDVRKMPVLDEVLEQLKAESPDPEICFQLAMQTMHAKSIILQQDKWEENWVASLLSYGHLHAHALEMASNFDICHGDSVLIGMMVDLKLAGNKTLYKKLLDVVPFVPLGQHVSSLNVDRRKLEDAYLHEPKDFFKDKETGGYKVLPLSQKGEYGGRLDANSPQKIFSLDHILHVYFEVVRDIQECLKVKTAPEFQEQPHSRNLE